MKSGMILDSLHYHNRVIIAAGRLITAAFQTTTRPPFRCQSNGHTAHKNQKPEAVQWLMSKLNNSL